MDEVLTLIMGGGAGERLQPLTRERAKAAVPFGGKFRLIDLTLSNCVNSGCRQVFVLIQYRSTPLLRHIQEGWGISSSRLGDFIYCVPAQQKLGADWYRGTADAVRQNLDLVTTKDFKHILILPGDHVHKMNYLQLVAYHKMKNADLTISAVVVRKEQAASNLGVIELGKDHRMIGFEEKPAQPKALADNSDYVLASMGIYVFRVSALRQALRNAGDHFGKEVIPGMMGNGFDIFVYDYEKENNIQDFMVDVKDGRRQMVLVNKTRDSSFWNNVGTIESYYEASMELLGVDPLFNLYGERWPFRTYQRPLPPSKHVVGGKTSDSIVSDGCIISGGMVRGCVLSPGVVVERDASVEESIIFDDVIIEPNARIRRAIIDKQVRIFAGASLGYDLEADRMRGCTVSDTGIVVVPKGMDIVAF